MRAIYNVILILVAICFVSCEKDVNHLIDQYLYVTFTTESGANPLMEIGTETDADIGYFENKYYTASVGKMKYCTIDNKRYINFSLFDPEGHKIKSKTYTLKCKTLFGDYETYTMTADFKEISGKDNELVCVRFTFEGVEYPVSPDGCVTVPLDIP